MAEGNININMFITSGELAENNGTWNCAQFDSGLMIQWGRRIGVNFNNQVGYSGNFSLPVLYKSGSQVLSFVSCDQSDINNYIFRGGATSTTTTFTFSLVSGSNEPITINNRSFNWMTIGYWK